VTAGREFSAHVPSLLVVRKAHGIAVGSHRSAVGFARINNKFGTRAEFSSARGPAAVPQRIKFAAFFLCLLPILTVVVARLGQPASFGPTRTTAPLHRPRPDSGGMPVWPLLIMAGGPIGAVVLLVDALRREYDQPKAVPVVLAIMGLLTLGVTSVTYYALWGYRPCRREAARATELCRDCVGQTRDRRAPGTGMHKLIGTLFIGSALPCPSCGSTVQTLWLFFITPILPLGSYRVVGLAEARVNRAWYVGRRLPRVYWPQVLSVYILLAGCGGLLALLVHRG
jgi:hypothetical protein